MIRRIDSHVHLYPPELNRDPAGWAAARGERHWSTLALRRRRNGSPVQAFPEPDDLIREMDRAGVERAVLLGWYWEHSAPCAEQNRHCAECLRRHPGRISAFAAIHPSAGDAAVAVEMERARDAGFCGLGELSPHAQGFAAADPVFGRVLARAGEWGWPVNLHTSDPEARAYPGRVETPADDFLWLARTFPGTRFILAHWGGLLPLRIPAAAGLGNLYYDSAASPLSYDAGIWRRMAGAVGADRIVFGSDYPLNLYPATGAGPEMGRLIAEAEGSGLGQAELRGIFAGNFETLTRSVT